VAAARAAGADLLVIGTARDGDGVVEGVIREAPCHVLVAKRAA
jgi:hypothetical protein